MPNRIQAEEAPARGERVEETTEGRKKLQEMRRGRQVAAGRQAPSISQLFSTRFNRHVWNKGSGYLSFCHGSIDFFSVIFIAINHGGQTFAVMIERPNKKKQFQRSYFVNPKIAVFHFPEPTLEWLAFHERLAHSILDLNLDIGTPSLPAGWRQIMRNSD